MQLTWIDWAVVALYFCFNIAIGLYYKQRAGQNVSEFFLSGRNVPWWLAGTSMVATTFAADTPLVVTGLAPNASVGYSLQPNGGGNTVVITAGGSGATADSAGLLKLTF